MAHHIWHTYGSYGNPLTTSTMCLNDISPSSTPSDERTADSRTPPKGGLFFFLFRAASLLAAVSLPPLSERGVKMLQVLAGCCQKNISLLLLLLYMYYMWCSSYNTTLWTILAQKNIRFTPVPKMDHDHHMFHAPTSKGIRAPGANQEKWVIR